MSSVSSDSMCGSAATSSAFEPHSSPKPVRTSGLHHLLNNLVKLVHLDRVDAVVAALVPKLPDGVAERLVKLHARAPAEYPGNGSASANAVSGVEVLHDLVDDR